jgi:signal transduction histidine kinase
VEVGPIIDTTIATATGLLKNKPIRLEKNVPDALPPVWADEGRVRQVLMNLYSNAVKFTESGSITLTITETSEGLLFSLKDTGVGIDPQYHEVIFEEFKQAESNAGRDPRAGSGLGLTISRQLLKLMGGRIWVESERGKGSTFNFVVQFYRNQDDGSHPKRPKDSSVSPDTQPEGQEKEKVV